jgi:hypothetical protein
VPPAPGNSGSRTRPPRKRKKAIVSETTAAGQPPASGGGYRQASKMPSLEERAAELDRQLLAATSTNGLAGGSAAAGTPEGPAALPEPVPGLTPDSEPADGGAFEGAPAVGGHADPLASYRRRPALHSRRPWVLRHWKGITAAGISLTAGTVAVLVTTGSPAPGWPASVATVQAEAKTACENPDTAAEPSSLNFACGNGTQQVLWVFSLLTSGDNPRYTDPATGREGLEPITSAQGGDIAWSLNLHHPYNPENPGDSLAVAARAINNIIAGATLTTANGGADVEPGLESTAANCQRYTGSPALVTRAGYPAACAAPLTATGTDSLVADVFAQWMTGAPAKTASDAGVLFENAGNPGSPQVQAILASLPASGQ